MQDGAEEKIQWLLQEYMPQLRFINEPHKKCLILFSGVPASGKSIMAEKIELSLFGVRISNDEQRALLNNRWPDLDKEEEHTIRQSVTRRIFERLQTAGNGLVIVDSSVDRHFDFYEAIARDFGYNIMLFRLDIPFDLLRRRIIGRPQSNAKPQDTYLEHLDQWWDDWKKFGENRQFDMIVTPETKLSEIVLAVVNRLTSLQTNS